MIVERLTRRFGFEAVAAVMPEQHAKLLTHIRKEKNRQRRQRGQEGGDEEVRVGFCRGGGAQHALIFAQHALIIAQHALVYVCLSIACAHVLHIMYPIGEQHMHARCVADSQYYNVEQRHLPTHVHNHRWGMMTMMLSPW